MPISHRARTNTERNQVADVINAYRASSSPDAAFVALDETLFASARADYLLARETWNQHDAARTSANLAAAAADACFERDLRLFAASVRDNAGHATPRVVSELLGGVLPSKLTRMSRRDGLKCAAALLDRLPQRTDLSYNTAHAEALKSSAEVLNAAVLTYEECDRAYLNAGDALSTARDAFDDAYARLLRAATSLLDTTTFTLIFPRFVRRNPKSDSAETASP